MTTRLTYDLGTEFIALNRGSPETVVKQIDTDLKQSKIFSAAVRYCISDKGFRERVRRTQRDLLYIDFIDRIDRLKISDGLLFNVFRSGYSKKAFSSLPSNVAEFFTDKEDVLSELMPLVLNRLQTLEERASEARTHLLPTIIVGANEQLSILTPQIAKSKTLSIPIFFVGNLKEFSYWGLIKQMTSGAFKSFSVQGEIKQTMLCPPEKRTTPFAVCVVNQTAKIPSLPKGCFPLDVRGNSLLGHLSKDTKLFGSLLQRYRKWIIHTKEKEGSVWFFHQIYRIHKLAEDAVMLETDFLKGSGLETDTRSRSDSQVGMQQVQMLTGEFKISNVRERTHTIGDEGRNFRDKYLYHLQELIHRIDVLKELKKKFSPIENGILTSLEISQQGLQTFVSKLYQEMQKQVPMSPRTTVKK